MTTDRIKHLLMRGATIEKGGFSGYWLCPHEGKRSRITPAQAAELLPLCTRIDDQKTRTGATWALCDCERPPTHISENCLIHNQPPDHPRFYVE